MSWTLEPVANDLDEFDINAWRPVLQLLRRSGRMDEDVLTAMSYNGGGEVSVEQAMIMAAVLKEVMDRH